MKFRTEIPPVDDNLIINYEDKIVTIGSCFAENIGSYFNYYKFKVLKNPFGVLYNPVSIANSLELIRGEKRFEKNDLIFDQSEYHSFYFHSDFSSHDVNECLNNINSAVESTRNFIKGTGLLIITLGTSFVFRHLQQNMIVSNCHKIPAKEFEMDLLTPAETKDAIMRIVKTVEQLNEKIKIIFTVSPVRHWKNGAVGNQLSKSNLIVAVHEVIREKNNLFYFPSYELMMDDLRDYRFYESDLLHPNKMATDYIWKKFVSSYFNPETVKVMEKVDKIIKSASHKPRNIKSTKHQNFLKIQLENIEAMKKEFPYIDLREIKDIFLSQRKINEN